MVNKGKRVGDSKKKKEVKSITFFHNPNDTAGLPDPIQQFDILDGIEKDKKVKPKDVFEDYKDPGKKTKPKNDEKKKHRNMKMNEMQQRGKRRGLDKKKVDKK